MIINEVILTHNGNCIFEPKRGKLGNNRFNGNLAKIDRKIPDEIKQSKKYRTYLRFSSNFFDNIIPKIYKKISGDLGSSLIIKDELFLSEMWFHDNIFEIVPLECYIVKVRNTPNDSISYLLVQSDTEKVLRESIPFYFNHIIKEIAQELDKKRNKLKAVKHPDNLILPEELQNELFGDLQEFLDSYSLYKKLKIPYKRGYIFYGPPGNGKTSTIKSLKEHFGLSVKNMLDHINTRKLSPMFDKQQNFSENTTVIDIDKYVIEKCQTLLPEVYYIEDIEKVTSNQSNSDSPVITLSSLLNILDGPALLMDGTIIIATTNEIDKFAESILGRPGRFDAIFEFKNPTKDEIKNLFDYYDFKINNVEKILNSLVGMNMSFAKEFIIACIKKYKSSNIGNKNVETILERIKKHETIRNKLKSKVGF